MVTLLHKSDTPTYSYILAQLLSDLFVFKILFIYARRERVSEREGEKVHKPGWGGQRSKLPTE